MLQYLVDTDICIRLRQARSPALMRRFAMLPHGAAAISVITLGELRVWVEKHMTPSQAEELLGFLRLGLETLPLPVEAAQEYGQIRADLERRGEIIGGNDLWIAAHARALKLTLVTNNEREFRRVRGLKIANWAA